MTATEWFVAGLISGWLLTLLCVWINEKAGN